MRFSLAKLAHLEGKEVFTLKDFQKALKESKAEYGCGIAGKACHDALPRHSVTFDRTKSTLIHINVDFLGDTSS